MVTLEKFRSYKTLFFQYRTSRFGILKFAGLSVLIVLLGISAKPEWIVLALNFVFVFVSMFVFRWIDDAWSFYQDRKQHPDRKYIRSENIRSFFMLGLIIYILYQTGLFLYSVVLAQTILILFLISTILYLAFYKNKQLMLLIPLLKYPVFIWCISNFSMASEVLFSSVGAFFIMLAVDFFEKYPARTDGIIVKFVLLIVSGLLVIQPWIEKSNIFPDVVLMVIPLFFILLKRIRSLHIFPIIIYPILHMIDLLY